MAGRRVASTAPPGRLAAGGDGCRRIDAWEEDGMTRRMAGWIVAAAMAVALAMSSAAMARTWTSAKGSQVEAELVAIHGDVVMLRAEDGSEFKIRLSDLSATDQAFVRESRPAAEAPAAVPPKPAAPPTLTRPGRKKADTGVMYTAEEIAAMPRRIDGLGRKGDERVEFAGGITFQKILMRNEQPWKDGTPIPIKITCELARVEPRTGGGEDRKPLSGNVRFYVTDEEGKVLVDRTASLRRMHHDTRGAGHEMKVAKPGKYTVVMVTEFENTTMGLTETIPVFFPIVPDH